MNYQDGYSQKALDALAKGKYKSFRSSGLANSRYTEGKKKRDNAVVKQNKTQNPTPRNTNAMANDPRFFAPSVSLPVPTLPMVNAMQGDPRFQVQPEYNGDEVLNQLLGGVKSPVKESPNLSDMIPKTPRESDTKSSKAKPSTRYTNETEKDFLGGLMADYADEHPFISTLNSFALNVGSTVEGIENALSGFLGESLFDPEKPVSDLYARRGLTKDSLAATKAKEGIRQTVQDNIDNGVGKFAYNTGTGLADMGINMAISGGNPVAMGVVSGAQNAAQNTLHARERGVDADKARKTGLATGVVAGVMNSVGLDSVLKSTAKTVAGQVLQGAGKEGLENVVEDIADIWIDNIINGDNSETSKTIQYYVQNGMSEEEAYKKSFVDYLNQELVSFASGAALGGAIGGAKKLPQLGAYVEGRLAERDARKNPTVAGILDGTITESPRVPDVVEQARAQTERAQAEIERLNEQLPEMPESTSNVNTMQNVDFKPSIHNADGQLLDTVKVPEYTADSNVFFNGSDTDIAFAEAQDAAITDTFRNIVSDPEFNALSFKNGRQEVYVSPSTNGEGYRVSYTVDGVPTGHHDYSINEIDDLSQNLREMAGNGGEDIRIQKKSDLARQTAERPFTEEQAALQAELDDEYNFDANEVAANDTGIESNPRITERYPFPEKADGSRPDYHNVEEVGTRLETTRQSIAKNNEDIEVLNKQLNDIPDLKKNAKERSALKKQIYQLEQQNKQSAKLEKILTKISEGKKVSNKDIFEVEFPDDYHAIFDGRGGFFGRVNMATKFAGDTPEAKALAQSIRDDIYAIAKGDFDPENLGGLLEKVYNLDRMAQETKADYRARGTGKNPSRVYKYDDFFAGTKNGIGDDFTSHVIQSLDKAYQIANNMTDIDTTSRVAEAAGESAPVETSAPENVAAESNQSLEQTPVQTPVETNRVPTVESPAETTTEEPELPATNNIPPNRPPIKLEQNENGDVVETGTSKHIRADGTPMKYDVDETVVDDFNKDPAMYRQLKNEDTKALSEAVYNSGDTPVEINGKTYEGNPETKFRQLLAEKNPAALYLGSKIAKDYSAQGNHKMAAQIYRDMSYSLKDAGQFTQASAIAMMKNDPLTALAYFEKQIDDLNKEGKAKYGKKWKKFELTDEERALFDGIENGDEKAIKEAYDKIGARIEKDYPVAWWEKVLEFRRIAMLFNTRTLSRNFFANPPTALLRYVSDRIEGVGQKVAHLINPDIEITQAVRGSNKDTRKLAAEVFKSDRVQNLLKTTPGRLSEVPKVGDYAKSKQIFKGGIISDLINKMTDNGIVKLNEKMGAHNAKSVLEAARNATYGALEITDLPFVRENFVSRLGSYMRAKGMTSIDEVDDKAINIALEEALKATYKDDSWLVQGLRKIKKGVEDIGNGVLPGSRAGDFMSQAIIPYVQAPGNIGARIVDYSAIGGANGIKNIIKGASNGDAKLISKGIEQASKGASGTLMAGIGMALYKAGIITGTYSTDKDQREFQKEHGFREFAIRWKSPIDGKIKYDTFDWAQPFSDTLMTGVLLAQAIENSDEYDSDILRHFGYEGTKVGSWLGAGRAAVGKEVNYFFNATPLKNLGELLEGGFGQDTDIAKNIQENMVEDFITGLTPAQGNALAKTIDTTQRLTYDPSNEFTSFVNALKARTPGVSKTLPEKRNTWGVPMLHGNNKFSAGFAKMFWPGEHTSDDSDWLDNEINNLFDETQDAKVFPHAAPNSIKGEKLTAEEKSRHQDIMGSQSRELAEAFVRSEAYQNLRPSDKADVLGDIYDLSKAVADHEIKGVELEKKQAERYDLYKQGKVQDILNSMVADRNPYGVSANEYNTALEEGTDLSDLEGYKDALKDNGLTNSKANQEIYKKGGEQALVSSAEQASQLGISTQDYNSIKSYAGDNWSKVEPELPTLKGLGVTNYSQYAHAVKYADSNNQSIDAQWFANTTKALDTDNSGGVSQDELINEFNNKNMSEDEVMRLWGMLALGKDGEETKQVPYIITKGKNKGKWGRK